VFHLYRITKNGEHPTLDHIANLETDKAVLEEMKRLGLHSGDVEVFIKKAEIKEKTEIWIEINGK
jgi:post-segregation antitoxin (ccd killing protein)